MPFRLRALFEEFFETKESCAAFRRGLGNLSKDSVPRSRFTAVYIHGDVKELRGNLRCELRRTFLRSFFQCFVNPAHRPPRKLTFSSLTSCRFIFSVRCSRCRGTAIACDYVQRRDQSQYRQPQRNLHVAFGIQGLVASRDQIHYSQPQNQPSAQSTAREIRLFRKRRAVGQSGWIQNLEL